ncbi:MAG: carboxypeptidase regulatory-like domain-containing protein [Myxococcota bacterium]
MRTSLLLILCLGCSETSVTPVPVVPDDDTSEDVVVTPKPDPIPDGVPRGGVKGLICLDKDSPVPGARVALEHEWGVAEANTDAEGNFSLENLPVGSYVLIVQTPEYSDQIPVEVPPNEYSWVETTDCLINCDIPVPCVGLAEAFDRGGAAVYYNEAGAIEVINTSEDLEICMDDWMVVFSETSQDATFGQRDPVRVGPGASTEAGYAHDVYKPEGADENQAWWCVEREQYTQAGSEYTYNGSLTPDLLYELIRYRTDVNSSLIEDHEEIVEGQYIQSQMNVWNTEIQSAIILVGRQRSLVQLRRPDSVATIVVEATNLGQKAGRAVVSEDVPAGFDVFGVSDGGVVSQRRDGGFTINWSVNIAGAVPRDNAHATYSTHELTYQISRSTDECMGRCPGYGVTAQWGPHASASEPLIIEVCETPEGT